MSQMIPSKSSAKPSPAGAGSTEGGRAVGAGQGWTWITGGFDLFRKQPDIWIANIVILLVTMLAVGSLSLLGAIATLVRIIATVLLLSVFMGGMMIGCETQQRGGSLEIGHLLAGFKRQPANLVVLGVLSFLAWVIVMIPIVAIMGSGAFLGMMRGDLAGASVMGGSFVLALLIGIALSIPVCMALWFAPALVVLRGVAPVAAIKQSFDGCLKNIVPFLIYGIAVLVLSVFATIPLLLGWLVLLPVLIASVYVAYRDIYGYS